MGEQAQDSGWYRASAVAADERPHLKVDLDVDICVIGGGLAGLSTALEAARLGASVALIESQRIGWNASGANCGVVAPGFGNDEADIVARLGRDHARALWTLSQEGVDRIREIAGELDLPVSDGLLEVATTDNSDRLVRRMQLLGDVFGAEVEGWQTEQVRSALNSERYFHGLQHRRAFHLHGLNYLRGLSRLAREAGVQIYETTDVTEIDAAGIRKRIVTPDGRLRANAIVLAGNVHLGKLFPRLLRTLLPVWRYAGVTEPLGDGLAAAMAYPGAVLETESGRQFRAVDGDRLMWSGPLRTRNVPAKRLRGSIQAEIRASFPQLREVPLADVWSGATGETVHGMPQIGQMNRGLWIASGFGRQGFNTVAMAGRLIARGILVADDRWRLFAPYELVWAGGWAGRLVGEAAYSLARQRASLAGVVARRRDRARRKAAAKASGKASASVSRTG